MKTEALGPFDGIWHSKSQPRGPSVTEVVVGPSTRVPKEAAILPSETVIEMLTSQHTHTKSSILFGLVYLFWHIHHTVNRVVHVVS